MTEVSPTEEILLTHFIVSDDVERLALDTEVLGGKAGLPRNRYRTRQCQTVQQLDCHQCRWRSDRRQA